MNGTLRTVLCIGGVFVMSWLTAIEKRPIDRTIGTGMVAPSPPGLQLAPGDAFSYQPPTPIVGDTPSTCAERLFFQYDYFGAAPSEARGAISHAHGLLADSFFALGFCSEVPVRVAIDW